jgi:aldehyde dehydrogenase (NAD+)
VIAPWNYPLQLILAPLLGAIAAGNCAILKPSELAPHTADVVNHLIAKAFAPEYVAVVEGGPELSTALLQRKFDYIFFTGGTGVGRIVSRAAAEQLTPVTLELGGKSPCIVDADADLDVAAKRIAWGKWFNAGQTCVAPDYLLLHRSIKTPFLAKLQVYITQFFGADPAESPDFARIINDKHFDRIASLIDGDVIIGGQTHRSTRYISPTVIDNVTLTDLIMQGEIFGPVLPIITYDHLDEAFDVVRQMPNPLALYLFAKNKQVQERVLTELSFGGGCINNTLAHLANPSLPFGGIGASGMGRYHGRYSFDTFSHKKAVLHSSTMFEPNLKYQPYREKLKLIRRLIK